jgi:hypothetical protein
MFKSGQHNNTLSDINLMKSIWNNVNIGQNDIISLRQKLTHKPESDVIYIVDQYN